MSDINVFPIARAFIHHGSEVHFGPIQNTLPNSFIVYRKRLGALYHTFSID